MQPGGPLPDPDDSELGALLGKRALIYKVLYENRDGPGLTYDEIQQRLPEYRGRIQFQRRVRDLRKYFVIEQLHNGPEVRHRLVRVRDTFADSGAISGRLRAKVLEKGRCYRCGKTPEEDGVKLRVDHRIPREWGGPTEEWNLQPLCDRCNREKKDRLSEYDKYKEKISAAIQHEEVQKRIGELLLAFEGEPVPSDLVQLVASAGRYRNDWERRFRELRTLGWDVRVKKVYKDGKPIDSVYWVAKSQPWPEGRIGAVLRRTARERKTWDQNGSVDV